MSLPTLMSFCATAAAPVAFSFPAMFQTLTPSDQIALLLENSRRAFGTRNLYAADPRCRSALRVRPLANSTSFNGRPDSREGFRNIDREAAKLTISVVAARPEGTPHVPNRDRDLQVSGRSDLLENVTVQWRAGKF
jgi:hypothetical protein